MSNHPHGLRRFRQFRFTTLLGLMTGIAIGFAPLKLWEVWRGSSPSIVLQMEMAEVDPQTLAELLEDKPDPTGETAGGHRKPSLIECADSLRQRGEWQTISRPSVMTIDDQPVIIQVGPVFYQVVPKLQRNGLIKLEYTFDVRNLNTSPTTRVSGQVELRSEEPVVVCSNRHSLEEGKPGRQTLVIVSARRLGPGGSLVGSGPSSPRTAAQPSTVPPAVLPAAQ